MKLPLPKSNEHDFKCLLFLLSLLWSLVEVHSQTAPYVSFMGENLTNHSYVDLNLLGTDVGNILRCSTDLDTCCTSGEGIHCGDWYFPDGNRLQPVSSGDDIYVVPGDQQVNIYRRNDALSPSGIYRCDIPTVAVHDDNNISVRETVYVGLYQRGEGNILYIS